MLLALATCTWPVSRRWLRNWGSRRDERERSWPGDDLFPSRAFETTRAITVGAPERSVWERVVQIGLERAGFYSYELLERLGGVPVRNIESVEPTWQSLSVGDEVLLLPRNGLRVSKMAEGSAICFGKLTFEGKDVDDGKGTSWSFYVEPLSKHESRLVVRTCLGPTEPSIPRLLAKGFEQALDFCMEQRMLRTIKRLCEDS